MAPAAVAVAALATVKAGTKVKTSNRMASRLAECGRGAIPQAVLVVVDMSVQNAAMIHFRFLKSWAVLLTAGVTFASGGSQAQDSSAPAAFFQDEQAAFGSAAVRVRRGHLVHSRSVGAKDPSGDLAKDFSSALDELAKSMPTRDYDGDGELRETLVKLHICVDPQAYSAAAIVSVMEKRWPDGDAPATTVVVASGGQNVVVDAVWQVEPVNPKQATVDWTKAFDQKYPASTGVLSPLRDIIHVSGRAASGELTEATSGTMDQLFEVLKGLGGDRTDVVQVKAFIQPIHRLDVAQQAIAASFDGVELPPIVFVEWISSSWPTEIELIATAPEKKDNAQSVSYYTPPADKASPVYSRVGRIHGNEVVFIGGITGTKGDTGVGEVTTLYDGLKRISAATGTDLRHLVKATYYVSADEPSAALNTLRPDYYDPERPPAASKVTVSGVGQAERGILIDMIAAPLK